MLFILQQLCGCLILLGHTLIAVLGPRSMLGHLYLESIPSLLGIHAVSGHLHQTLQNRCVSISILLNGSIDAEIVRDMTVGIVVRNPLKASKILAGFQRSLFPRIDA